MIRKKTLWIIVAVIVFTILLAFQFINYVNNYIYNIWGENSIEIKAEPPLEKSKIKIEFSSMLTIKQLNDSCLFAIEKVLLYNNHGEISSIPKTDYGENDFFFTYDNKYSFRFRHFILNRNCNTITSLVSC